MNCRKAQRLLVEFLEGALSARSREEIESHLKACGRCRKERDLLATSWQMLGTYDAPEAPADFTASLMRRIHSEQAPLVKVRFARPWFGVPQLIPTLAVILALGVAVALFWKKPQGTNVAQISRAKVSGAQSSFPVQLAVRENDSDIIQNLDVLEDADLLQNINIAQELDAIESLDAGNV